MFMPNQTRAAELLVCAFAGRLSHTMVSSRHGSPLCYGTRSLDCSWRCTAVPSQGTMRGEGPHMPVVENAAPIESLFTFHLHPAVAAQHRPCRAGGQKAKKNGPEDKQPGIWSSTRPHCNALTQTCNQAQQQSNQDRSEGQRNPGTTPSTKSSSKAPLTRKTRLWHDVGMPVSRCSCRKDTACPPNTSWPVETIPHATPILVGTTSTALRPTPFAPSTILSRTYPLTVSHRQSSLALLAGLMDAVAKS